MNQSDNAIHTSADDSSIIIPCLACGTPDSIEFSDFREVGDEDEATTMCVSVSIQGNPHFWSRIANAWRALQNKTHQDGVMMSRKTVLALAQWLERKTHPIYPDDPGIVKIWEAPKPIPPTPQSTQVTLHEGTKPSINLR